MHKLLFAALAMASAAPSAAAVQIYTDQVAFAAALGGVSTNGFSADACPPNDDGTGSCASYQQNGVTFSADGQGLATFDDGAYASNSPYLEGDSPVSISTAVAGVGFDIGSFGVAYGAPITVTYTANGVVGSFILPPEDFGSYQTSFIGFIDDSGVSVAFETNPILLTGEDGSTFLAEPGVDVTHFYTGALSSDVPEPASWAMMIAGFGLVGTVLRRRKAAVRFG